MRHILPRWAELGWSWAVAAEPSTIISHSLLHSGARDESIQASLRILIFSVGKQQQQHGISTIDIYISAWAKKTGFWRCKVVTCDGVTRCRVSRRLLSRHCLALILTNGPPSQCADHAAIRELPHTRLQSVRRWGHFDFYVLPQRYLWYGRDGGP